MNLRFVRKLYVSIFLPKLAICNVIYHRKVILNHTFDLQWIEDHAMTTGRRGNFLFSLPDLLPIIRPRHQNFFFFFFLWWVIQELIPLSVVQLSSFKKICFDILLGNLLGTEWLEILPKLCHNRSICTSRCRCNIGHWSCSNIWSWQFCAIIWHTRLDSLLNETMSCEGEKQTDGMEVFQVDSKLVIQVRNRFNSPWTNVRLWAHLVLCTMDNQILTVNFTLLWHVCVTSGKCRRCVPGQKRK